MTILTASSTFTVLPSPVATETADITVLPLTAATGGKGRMVHPTLGVLDYPYAPDEWDNIDLDIIVPPVIGYQQTLGGMTATVHNGSMQDIVCVERWTSDVSLPVLFVRALLNFWMNMPAPETGQFVKWYPSYTTDLGYNVIIMGVSVNGSDVTFDYISRQGWVAGEVAVRFKAISYA